MATGGALDKNTGIGGLPNRGPLSNVGGGLGAGMAAYGSMLNASQNRVDMTPLSNGWTGSATPSATPMGGGGGIGGAVPPTVPTPASPEASAMLSMDAAGTPPEMAMPVEGPMLRQLGRRSYPQESTALASMGRIY